MAASSLFSRRGRDEEDQWLTVSDLMAGLMIIFLFIAITYIRDIKLENARIRDIAVAWETSREDIFDALKDEFSDDLAGWDAELRKEDLAIRFRAPDIMFAAGDSAINPEFKAILDEFFPRYIQILSTFKDQIDEVRIEGHTSSDWAGTTNKNFAYFQNMELSQDRTRAVLEYGLLLPAITNEVREWARKYLTANGLSSSQIQIDQAGNEQREISRRVEFVIRTRAEEKISCILDEGKSLSACEQDTPS